jgi:aldehyde dehydrogenase (NAD+)
MWQAINDESFNRVVQQSGCALSAKGCWYPPTFLTGVTALHRVAQEEIFGPVLSG